MSAHTRGATDDLAYRPAMSTWWWLRKRSYFVFVMRELSSLFTAWFVVFLLLMLRSVRFGPASYADFLDWADTPWVVALNVVGAVFLVLHVVTWFNLTPKAMPPLRLGGRPVPAAAVIAAQYAGLAVLSAFVVWLVTR